MSLTQPQRDALTKMRRTRRFCRRTTLPVTVVVAVLFVLGFFVDEPWASWSGIALGIIVIVEFFVEMIAMARAIDSVAKAFPEEIEHESDVARL